MNQKSILRTNLRRHLETIDLDAFKDAEHIINTKLRSIIDWSTIKQVCMYDAQEKLREFSIEPFRQWLLESQPHVNTQLINFDSKAAMPGVQFDIIILPLLGYDKNYNRIGRGAGWYDKFLSSQHNAITIALAHSSQKVVDLPTEEHDQKVDLIVTEKPKRSIQ